MTESEIYRELQNLSAILDAETFPKLHDYLDSIIVKDDEKLKVSPYVIANKILDCDRPQVFPQTVIDTITLLFKEAFRAGEADAMNDLGAQYYTGARGFEQSFAKAVQCYEFASQSGSRQAQENLGYCYYYGRNMPVNYEKAFHYFALGAFDGHLISLYKIGDMYANGYYVQKNEVEAFQIYNHCLDAMTDEYAKKVAGPVFLRLGKAYLYGNGTKPNAHHALVCFQKAEVFLYDMVKDGDEMYRKSLQSSIDGQAQARVKLREEIKG